MFKLSTERDENKRKESIFRFKLKYNYRKKHNFQPNIWWFQENDIPLQLIFL